MKKVRLSEGESQTCLGYAERSAFNRVNAEATKRPGESPQQLLITRHKKRLPVQATSLFYSGFIKALSLKQKTNPTISLRDSWIFRIFIENPANTV